MYITPQGVADDSACRMYARRHPQHRNLQITSALKDTSSCSSPRHMKAIKRPQPPRIPARPTILSPSHIPLQLRRQQHTTTMWLAFLLPIIFIGYILALVYKLEQPTTQPIGHDLRPSRRQEKRTAKLAARRDRTLPRDALILATNTPRDSPSLA